jgi:hypothetical protein
MLWRDASARVKGESPPRRHPDTAWESYPGVVPPTRPVQPSSAHCGGCAARPMSALWHCATHPVRPPCRTPRRRAAAPSKEVRMPTPRSRRTMSWRQASGACLLRHLRPCAAIPVAVPPSQALQRHPQHCGGTGWRDIATPAIVWLPASVSMTLEPTYGRQPSKRLPRHYPRRSSWTGTGLAATPRQKQDSPGRPPTPWRCTPYRHT